LKLVHEYVLDVFQTARMHVEKPQSERQDIVKIDVLVLCQDGIVAATCISAQA
jgi:hypothetical protein